MTDHYSRLAAALAADGIRCQFQAAGQMVVSHQPGSIWPDRGNSFWITHVASHWHLFSWVPVGYRVPDSADMAALCRACMASGDSAMYRVPAEIAEQFGLIELSERDAQAVFREMDRDA